MATVECYICADTTNVEIGFCRTCRIAMMIGAGLVGAGTFGVLLLWRVALILMGFASG